MHITGGRNLGNSLRILPPTTTLVEGSWEVNDRHTEASLWLPSFLNVKTQKVFILYYIIAHYPCV